MTIIPDPTTRLRLEPLSRLANGPKWRLESMRARPEPVLYWVTSGQGRINVAGSTRGFHPHNAIFLPAGVMHAFQAMTRVQGTIVHFSRTHGLQLPDEPLHLRLRDGAVQAEITQVIDAMQRELDGGKVHADRAARAHLSLLAVWLDRQLDGATEDRVARPRTASEKLAARFMALLEREFGSSLNIADYSAALGVTPTHLTRACKAACGRTALEVLQERRLFEARRLLLETDTPVQEIARNLGFSTPGYFARAFAARVGQPPSVWRKGNAVRAVGLLRH